MQKTAVKIPNIDNTIRNMSGGQRQCVAIARAAAFASKLVIMDEPTAALGVQETGQVENIIRGLKDRGIPLILVSHNLRQVFDLVDRIWVFRRGRIAGVVDAKKTTGNDVVSMDGYPLEPGKHRFEIEVFELNMGRLHLAFDDTLKPSA